MLRSDQRQPGQLRPVSIETGYLKTAEGSAMIDVGNTRVLCAATVENTLPSWLRNSGRGWVTAEYSMLPRATAERTQREVNKGKPSGRTQEIQRLIGRSLRSVIDMEALGERTITVDCDVIQADGGTRTAAISGGYVAMALAIKKLLEFGVLTRNPIRDFVAATSVGIVNKTVLLDLAYDEDSTAEVDMNVVMTGSGEFIELQATAEKTPFGDERLLELLGAARVGIGHLIAAQKQALGAK